MTTAPARPEQAAPERLKEMLDTLPRARFMFRALAVMDTLIRARGLDEAVRLLPMTVLQRAHGQLEFLARGLPDRPTEHLRSRVARALYERSQPAPESLANLYQATDLRLDSRAFEDDDDKLPMLARFYEEPWH